MFKQGRVNLHDCHICGPVFSQEMASRPIGDVMYGRILNMSDVVTASERGAIKAGLAPLTAQGCDVCPTSGQEISSPVQRDSSRTETPVQQSFGFQIQIPMSMRCGPWSITTGCYMQYYPGARNSGPFPWKIKSDNRQIWTLKRWIL